MYGSVWQCMVVYWVQGGVWWCMVVYSGVRWCAVVYADAFVLGCVRQLCMVVYGGVWWCMAVHASTWQCMLVYGDVLLLGCLASDSKKSSSCSSSDDNDDELLFVGKQIGQDVDHPPKAELFRVFGLKGHKPIQRNIRSRNIQVCCKDCAAKCSASTYRQPTDAWYVTCLTDEVGKQCRTPLPGMLLYVGVWWVVVIP